VTRFGSNVGIDPIRHRFERRWTTFRERHAVCFSSGGQTHILSQELFPMTKFNRRRAGKVKYAMLGWLIGLPLPIIILLLFFRGCDF
jgi:hypothetical protein